MVNVYDSNTEYDQKVVIEHLDGSKYYFENVMIYEEDGLAENPAVLIIESEHCGDFTFYREDLADVEINGATELNKEEVV